MNFFADATAKPARLADVFRMLAIYVACVLVFNLAVASMKMFPPGVQPPLWLPFVYYFCVGFALNRLVLRKAMAEWHPMTNTLRGVTNYKLWCFVAWPIAYPFLVVRLFIHWLL